MFNKFNQAEKIIFLCAYSIIILTFIIFKSGTLELIVSLLFLSGAMLNTKGIRYGFFFSGLSVLIYSYVSFNNRFYSEVIINILYMIPIQIWGFIKWKKDNIMYNKLQVKSLNFKQYVITGFFIVAVTIGYGYFLLKINNALPYVSAISTACSVLGSTFAAKKIKQQFIFWILNNLALIVMWFSTLNGGTVQLPILILNIIFIIINIKGLLNWNSMYKQQNKS